MAYFAQCGDDTVRIGWQTGLRIIVRQSGQRLPYLRGDGMVDERGGERVSQSHVLQRFHRRIMRGTVAQAEAAAPNDRNGILVQTLVQQG